MPVPERQGVRHSEPGYFDYAVGEQHNFHLDLDGLHFFDEERRSGSADI